MLRFPVQNPPMSTVSRVVFRTRSNATQSQRLGSPQASSTIEDQPHEKRSV